MSLTHCPNCHHENSWRRIYTEMNRKHRCVGELAECEHCNRKMIVHRKYSNIYLRILYGILWMLPALVLIGLVALRILDYKIAIVLVILYHIIALWGIIKFGNYTETK